MYRACFCTAVLLLACNLAPERELESSEGRAALDDLAAIARDSLGHNIATLAGRRHLSAGARQFRSLWTRDFGLSVPGLLAAGEHALVRDHTLTILNHVREEDGMAPRLLDSLRFADLLPPGSVTAELDDRYFIPVGLRYVLGHLGIYPELEENLRAEYRAGGGEGHVVIDANALTVLAALQYTLETGDRSLVDAHGPSLQRLLEFYDPYLAPDGLISQPPFSDWQDNINREGKTLYTNVLYWAVLRHAYDLGLWNISAGEVRQRAQTIWSTFYDARQGLPVSIAGHSYVSIGGIYLLLEHELLDWVPGWESRMLYEPLVAHPIWGDHAAGIPGLATYPDYPLEWNVGPLQRLVEIGAAIDAMQALAAQLGTKGKLLSWAIDRSLGWIADLQRGQNHYSDAIYHSQTIAWAAHAAILLGHPDEGQRILLRMQEIARRDGLIQEVFEPTPELPVFRNTLFESEHPFSWGSAALLAALSELNEASN